MTKELQKLEQAQKELEEKLQKLELQIAQKQTELEKLQQIEEELISIEKAKYAVEKKYNGFHAVLHKKGTEVKIFSEQEKDISNAFPTLCDAAKTLTDADIIIDGELVPYKGKEPLGRNELMKFIGAIKSGKKVDDKHIKMHVWDIVYYNKDITDLPLRERRKVLSKLKFNSRILPVSAFYVPADKNELKKAIEKATKLKGSEGAVIKDLDAPYVFDEKSRAWIKYRHLVDFHAIIIDKIRNKAGNFNYVVGVELRPKDMKYIDSRYVVEVNGKKVLKLGKTFNTEFDVPIGSIADIMVEEVWRHESPRGIRYSIHKPRFRHPRPDRSTSSTIDDLEDIVTSIGVAVKELREDNDYGETHTEAAEKFWKENWFRMYPKSGKGQFIYHHHWRGLTEEETKLDDKTLMCETNHSIHGDLRHEVDRNTLWGFTVFFGTAKENCEKYPDKLIYQSKTKEKYKMQGSFKLAMPHSWLEVGKRKPLITQPGGIGSTAKKFAKFFAIDWGTYEMGVWREHFFEVFYHGKHLKGRAIISYAPVGGSRKWLIYFPEDQTPYADKHTKEEIIAELKKKGQKYLIWAKPGVKPELIEIK